MGSHRYFLDYTGRCLSTPLRKRNHRTPQDCQRVESRRRLINGSSSWFVARDPHRNRGSRTSPQLSHRRATPALVSPWIILPRGLREFHYFFGMQIHLSPRHLTLTAAIYAYVAEKINHLEQLTDRILDVHYDDLVSNPAEVVRRLYRQLDLTLTPGFLSNVCKLVASRSRHARRC